MARFLALWRVNTAVPVSTDPSKSLELNEKMWAAMDGLIKKGEIEEFGIFPDGYSGFAISKGETADLFKNVTLFHPYFLTDVHEIIPYEKQKETLRAILNAQIAAAKK